ncbi:MAG: hypothetical protein V4487_08615 [Chlamydiota bacterium]
MGRNDFVFDVLKAGSIKVFDRVFEIKVKTGSYKEIRKMIYSQKFNHSKFVSDKFYNYLSIQSFNPLNEAFKKAAKNQDRIALRKMIDTGMVNKSPPFIYKEIAQALEVFVYCGDIEGIEACKKGIGEDCIREYGSSVLIAAMCAGRFEWALVFFKTNVEWFKPERKINFIDVCLIAKTLSFTELVDEIEKILGSCESDHLIPWFEQIISKKRTFRTNRPIELGEGFSTLLRCNRSDLAIEFLKKYPLGHSNTCSFIKTAVQFRKWEVVYAFCQSVKKCKNIFFKEKHYKYRDKGIGKYWPATHCTFNHVSYDYSKPIGQILEFLKEYAERDGLQNVTAAIKALQLTDVYAQLERIENALEKDLKSMEKTSSK